MKKTIKIIDLLNKIANGEEVPKYVEYRNWNNNSFEKMLVCKENIFYKLNQLEIFLNDRVEIMEEDKKIEKIKSLNNVGNCQDLIEFKDKQQLNNHILKNKINEIIDRLNELKGKSE